MRKYDHLPPVACSAAADSVRAQARQPRVAIRRVTALRALGASSGSCASAVNARVWLLTWGRGTARPAGASWAYRQHVHKSRPEE